MALAAKPCWLQKKRGRNQGRSVKLCVNGIFSCEISILPLGHCSWAFLATLLWYLLVGDFTLEKSLWQQNHFAATKTMSKPRNPGHFKAGFQPHYCKEWDLSKVGVSSLRTQIQLRNGFSFPFVFEAKQLLFFFTREKKNVLMHKTLFFSLSFIWNWT